MGNVSSRIPQLYATDRVPTAWPLTASRVTGQLAYGLARETPSEWMIGRIL